MTKPKHSASQQGLVSNMLASVSRALRLSGLVGLVVAAGLAAAPARAEITILVVDQQSILRDSLAGQDVGRQANALRQQIGQEIEAEQKSILDDEKQLQANAKVLSPAQRDQKAAAINDRRRAYPLFEQRKGQVLQLSVARATNEIAAVLQPLLQELVEEKKADLVIDRQAVLYAKDSYDITGEAIKRLNEKLKTVKLERVSLDQPAEGSAAPKAPKAKADEKK